MVGLNRISDSENYEHILLRLSNDEFVDLSFPLAAPGNILHALAAPHRIARPSDVLGFRDVAAVMELLRAREGDFLMKALYVAEGDGKMYIL